MHPEVVSDKPGNCPICGMKLTVAKTNNKLNKQITLVSIGIAKKLS